MTASSGPALAGVEPPGGYAALRPDPGKGAIPISTTNSDTN